MSCQHCEFPPAVGKELAQLLRVLNVGFVLFVFDDGTFCAYAGAPVTAKAAAVEDAVVAALDTDAHPPLERFPRVRYDA